MNKRDIVRLEGQVAQRLGGVITVDSGSKGQVGDVRLMNFMVECKATASGSLRISADMLAKTASSAVGLGKNPALHLTFFAGKKTQDRFDRWVAVPEHVFVKMLRGEEL